MPNSYIVAATKSWNRRIYDESIRDLPGEWTFIGSKDELTEEKVQAVSPRYIFFPHWSWIVPDALVENYECVCFHMADVPYGRGGSPLQNLIVRGHKDTKLTALRMVSELDAGPVYLKRDLSLEGTAQEILIRAGELAAEMIAEIIKSEPTPVPQEGEPVTFKRRRPKDSEIPELSDEEHVYDFIRMLDGEGYPPAFLRHAGFRYEFTRAALTDGRVTADVTIVREEEKE